MRLECKQKTPRKYFFQDLEAGTVFKVESDVYEIIRYMKLKYTESCVYTATKLDSGELCKFLPNAQVVIVEGAFVEA